MEMSDCQDLIASCNMLSPEILEIVRMRVYVAKLQERRDMGWSPLLAEIR